MSDDALEVHLSQDDLERLRRLARASGKSEDEVVGDALRTLEDRGLATRSSSPGISPESIERLIKMAEGQEYVKERVRGGKW